MRIKIATEARSQDAGVLFIVGSFSEGHGIAFSRFQGGKATQKWPYGVECDLSRGEKQKTKILQERSLAFSGSPQFFLARNEFDVDWVP